MNVFDALAKDKPARPATVVDQWLQTLPEQDRLDFYTAAGGGQYTIMALFRVAKEYGYESSFSSFRTWVTSVN